MARAQGLLRTSVLDGTPKNPDLFITFYEDESKYAWRFKVGSNRLAKLLRHLDNIEDTKSSKIFYTDRHTFKSPQDLIQEVYERINHAASTGQTSSQIIEEIKRLGNSLYDRLFPETVKDIYWSYLSENKSLRKISIIIKSSEPWIPWEIIRPFNQTTRQEDGFLCENFELARWISGVALCDVISLNQHKIIATSHLQAADVEVEEIESILGSRVARESSLYLEVCRLLERGEFSGLHFVCHGSYNSNNSESSELHLDEGNLRPLDINGPYTFCQTNPFIFLNACETGQISYALTGLGGWADAFIRRIKGSGFIGSIWEADDELACKFAKAFYRYLIQGKTVAEAVRLSREELKKLEPNNPTWLTYTVYANPVARIMRSEIDVAENKFAN